MVEITITFCKLCFLLFDYGYSYEKLITIIANISNCRNKNILLDIFSLLFPIMCVIDKWECL